MPANVEGKIEFLTGQIWSRETWLRDHAGKFPEHVVDTKRHGLEMLTDIKNDYERSLEAAKRRQEAAE